MHYLEPNQDYRDRSLRNDTELSVDELKADAETPLKLVVKVWDAITKSGVEINDIPLRISLEE